jgi:O-antigen/teichoic acid export membrane protein
VRGVGWNLIATVFTQGSTLALNLILANLWGRQAFGQYAIVQSTLTALTSGAQVVTSATATKYAAELRTRDPARAGRILGLCGLVALAVALTTSLTLLVGADTIATSVLKDPSLTGALMIISAAVLFNVVSGFSSGALAGLESFPAIGRAGIVTGTLYVTVSAAGGWAFGITGATLGLALSALVQCVVLLAVLVSEASDRGIHITARGVRQELGVLFTFLAPSAFNSLVAFPALWVANTFLVRQDGGFQQMALFSAANSFRILVLFLPAIVNSVGLSLLNSQRGAAHEMRYRRVFWTNLMLNGAMVTAGGAAVALTGPWLLGSYGEEFRVGYPVLLILMLSTLPETVAIAVLQTIQSRGRVWLSFFAIVIPGYGTLAVLAYLLTVHNGAIGLAWSYTAAMSVSFVAALCIVNRLGIWDDPSAPLPRHG